MLLLLLHPTQLLVAVESVVPHETCPTPFTIIRLLARVQPHMSLTVVAPRKGQWTGPAQERPLGRVGLHVRRQIVGPRKDLVAPGRRARETGRLDFLELVSGAQTLAPSGLGALSHGGCVRRVHVHVLG